MIGLSNIENEPKLAREDYLTTEEYGLQMCVGFPLLSVLIYLSLYYYLLDLVYFTPDCY